MINLFKQIRVRLGRQNKAPPKPLLSGIHPIPMPLVADEGTPWQPCYLFNGVTPNQLTLSCHASALAHDHCPHPPHVHDEEELLLVLTGEVEITLPALNEARERCQRLRAGQFVYYPKGFPHTIRTLSQEPANYLMFKWTSNAVEHRVDPKLAFARFQPDQHDQEHPAVEGYFSKLLFEGSTRHLARLHCHATRLRPGSGYPAHEDLYDVAIVLLEGECESLGQQVEPISVLFYAAGEPHGIRNTAIGDARYLVFEFHSPNQRPRIWQRLFRTPRKNR